MIWTYKHASQLHSALSTTSSRCSTRTYFLHQSSRHTDWSALLRMMKQQYWGYLERDQLIWPKDRGQRIDEIILQRRCGKIIAVKQGNKEYSYHDDTNRTTLCIKNLVTFASVPPMRQYYSGMYIYSLNLRSSDIPLPYLIKYILNLYFARRFIELEEKLDLRFVCRLTHETSHDIVLLWREVEHYENVSGLFNIVITVCRLSGQRARARN